ncbi:MAG: hypothetical protein A2W93_07235 [Bacteroidetes bacterium GWF2_43_63]|nr:MAG: hypothetical protein A2W94_15305 [Bacteroidetes bacterium GWE2_42_42]OFY54022.1 MAG: hypothetical protein A2W93_07235 [Bacteroidetes bacterium GWF2_43_63]HCB63570.1 calcium:proton exchanger [Bacteroidales bacterium]HCY23184.1 calcium:proton exchanger [Bacteroidales bacterium]
MLIDVAFIIASLALLYIGARWLVTGSSKLASMFGISDLVVGLTIVAFGTSSPELIVSITASAQGQTGIAIGNVVGSNILNILLILGLTSLINPVFLDKRIIRSDIPLLIVISGVFTWALFTLELKWWEGIVLLSGFVFYAIWMIHLARKDIRIQKSKTRVIDRQTFTNSKIGLFVLMIIAGFGLLAAGSQLMVEGAVNIARTLDVSEAIIGLTVVSVGTSLPELATSVVAALKKRPGLAVGNLVGSNIFNILVIAGFSISIYPSLHNVVSITDILFMMGSALVIFPMAISGSVIRRIEGALLLGLYVLYIFLIWPK